MEQIFMRKDGVRITHDPYAKGVAEKYGKPEETDPEGFDPYQDSVGAGIYGGRVKRDDKGKIIYGKQYQNHNPKPGPVYAGHGYADLVDALKHGEDAVLRELDNGSDVNEVLTGGATPLHMCGMSQKNQLMTKLLIDRGADIEALDTYGYTPLHRMASNNLVIGAKALLDAGADPENVGEAGETPLQVAMSSFAVDVVQVLRNHMSKRQKVSLEEFEIRKCGVTDLIGKYKRLESDGNIPRGFAKVCRESNWNAADMWKNLNRLSCHFESENGAYAYLNADGKWWLDAPSGEGVYVAFPGGDKEADRIMIPKHGWTVIGNGKKPLPEIEF